MRASAVFSPTGNGDRYRHATLSGRAVGGAHDRVDRLVEIGVRHDDHVVLRAAERLESSACARFPLSAAIW
jgi:hypothetical protein